MPESSYAEYLHKTASEKPIGVATALQAILLHHFKGNAEAYATALLTFKLKYDTFSVSTWAETFYPNTDPRESDHFISEQFSIAITHILFEIKQSEISRVMLQALARQSRWNICRLTDTIMCGVSTDLGIQFGLQAFTEDLANCL